MTKVYKENERCDSDPVITYIYTPTTGLPNQSKYVNKQIEVRISSKFLTISNRNVYNRNLWGGFVTPSIRATLPFVQPSNITKDVLQKEEQMLDDEDEELGGGENQIENEYKVENEKNSENKNGNEKQNQCKNEDECGNRNGNENGNENENVNINENVKQNENENIKQNENVKQNENENENENINENKKNKSESENENESESEKKTVPMSGYTRACHFFTSPPEYCPSPFLYTHDSDPVAIQYHTGHLQLTKEPMNCIAQCCIFRVQPKQDQYYITANTAVHSSFLGTILLPNSNDTTNTTIPVEVAPYAYWSRGCIPDNDTQLYTIQLVRTERLLRGSVTQPYKRKTIDKDNKNLKPYELKQEEKIQVHYSDGIWNDVPLVVLGKSDTNYKTVTIPKFPVLKQRSLYAPELILMWNSQRELAFRYNIGQMMNIGIHPSKWTITQQSSYSMRFEIPKYSSSNTQKGLVYGDYFSPNCEILPDQQECIEDVDFFEQVNTQKQNKKRNDNDNDHDNERLLTNITQSWNQQKKIIYTQSSKCKLTRIEKLYARTMRKVLKNSQETSITTKPYKKFDNFIQSTVFDNLRWDELQWYNNCVSIRGTIFGPIRSLQFYPLNIETD